MHSCLFYHNYFFISIQSLMACAMDIAKSGPLGFFKGFFPAFVRLGPHTVITFIFFEQIRQNFGYIPAKTTEKTTEG